MNKSELLGNIIVQIRTCLNQLTNLASLNLCTGYMRLNRRCRHNLPSRIDDLGIVYLTIGDDHLLGRMMLSGSRHMLYLLDLLDLLNLLYLLDLLNLLNLLDLLDLLHLLHLLNLLDLLHLGMMMRLLQ